MRVLVTGAAGFIGRNLVERLRSDECPEVEEVFECTLETPEALLDGYCRTADFVFHLAGVNRPEDVSEFTVGNVGVTERLLAALEEGTACPLLISSSTQAVLDNPYGASKRVAEQLVFSYGEKTGASVFVYRLPGVFGKWSQPNYNSVVATFCHNTAHGLPLTISDRERIIALAYIDDVVGEFTRAMLGGANRLEDGYCAVPIVHETTLGRIVDLLEGFRDGRTTLSVPKMDDPFIKKLYSTYLSYLPAHEFSYPLNTKGDERGSFTEIIRTADRGQFSVNVLKPGVTKGNHWHNTKSEKFVVVSGEGIVRFRRVGDTSVIEYPVSGESIEVVDIPPGYTHSIENTGSVDMITFMWSNECFDADNPDTHFLTV